MEEYLGIALISFLIGNVFTYRYFAYKKKSPSNSNNETEDFLAEKNSDEFKIIKKNYKEESESYKRKLSLLGSVTNDGIWEWDISKNKVFWSKRSVDLLGLDEDVLSSKEGFTIAKTIMHPDDVKKFENALSSSLISNDDFEIEIRLKNINDFSLRYRVVKFKGQVVRNQQQNPTFFVGTIFDISSNKQMEEQLIYDSFHDVMTGVYNRKYFMDCLDNVLLKSKERPDYVFALIIIDLDKFTLLNESMGNNAGNEILKEVALRLDYCRRPNDWVARIGGDEFVVLLDDVKLSGDATIVASKIQNELRKPFIFNEKEFFVTASMGIAYNGEEDKDNEEVLSNVYAVLRKAKAKGNGFCEIFIEGMRARDVELYRLERDLREAINRDELHLVYQPIVDVFNNDVVVGFEALVRWESSHRGVIYPSDFIPMAEESGLIIPMGEWILNEACRQAKEWVEMGYSNITMAVNFSGKQFLNKDLPQMVEKILRSTKLSPKNLKIEVTETTAMNSIEQTITILKYLNKMGIKISVDDFGTGYSSLSSLKSYPIHTLKIDRSFVQDLPDDKDDVAITSTIISMAKNLNLNIIAEGVETKAQLDFLRSKGCNYIQGYYFSKPLDYKSATKLLIAKTPVDVKMV